MEKCETVAEGGHDSVSTGCNDERSDDLAAWASGLRRRAHLCKSLRSTFWTQDTRSKSLSARKPYAQKLVLIHF